MDAKSAASFGESLVINRDFRRWLKKLTGLKESDSLDVKLNPASHLGYTFHSPEHSLHVKFYGIPTGSWKNYDAEWAMRNEYKILSKIYNNGFNNDKHRVIKPLGINKHFYAALATEHVKGPSLSQLMIDVAKGADGKKLTKALTNTAHALRTMHYTMTPRSELDLNLEFDRLEEETTLGLRNKGLSKSVAKKLAHCRTNEDYKRLGGVTVHGDANPTNFISQDGTLYVMDFERLEKNRSPLLDLGFMIADLKHHFMFYGGNGGSREYIDGFLSAYSKDTSEDYIELVRPYVGCGLIRITKFINASRKHRHWLTKQAFDYLEK